MAGGSAGSEREKALAVEGRSAVEESRLHDADAERERAAVARVGKETLVSQLFPSSIGRPRHPDLAKIGASSLVDEYVRQEELRVSTDPAAEAGASYAGWRSASLISREAETSRRGLLLGRPAAHGALEQARTRALEEVVAAVTPLRRGAILSQVTLAAANPTIAARGQTCVEGRALARAAERRAVTLYRQAVEDGAVDLNNEDPLITAALAQAGAGQALSAAVRKRMEAELGYDLGRVRVHTDSVASKAAQAVRARAFTVGEDIFFAEGAFAPESPDGDKLLAHELTHVVQAWQGRARMATNRHEVSDPSEELEREAAAFADRIGSNVRANVAQPAPLGSPVQADTPALACAAPTASPPLAAPVADRSALAAPVAPVLAGVIMRDKDDRAAKGGGGARANGDKDKPSKDDKKNAPNNKVDRGPDVTPTPPPAARKADPLAAKQVPNAKQAAAQGPHARPAPPKSSHQPTPRTGVAPHVVPSPPGDVSPPVVGKVVLPASSMDAPTVSPPAPFAISATADPTLRAELQRIGEQITSSHDELMALSVSLQKDVTSSMASYAATIDAQVVAGSARVGRAYDEIELGVDNAAKAARDQIDEREATLTQVIKNARTKKQSELDDLVTRARVTQTQNLISGPNVVAATKVATQFATRYDQQRGSIKAKIEAVTGPASPWVQKYNPKVVGQSVKYIHGPMARAIGMDALTADKKLSVVTTVGEKLHQPLDLQLRGTADHLRSMTSGTGVIQELLRAAEHDLEDSLEVRRQQQAVNLDAAEQTATASLTNQIAQVRTGLDDATKQASARIQSERDSAQKGATTAGTKLSENISAASKEIASHVAAKAAKDASSYSQLTQQLQKLARGKKLDPATKAQLDQLSSALTASYEQSRIDLQEMAKEGLDTVRSDKERDYEIAISGYEQAAAKSRTEIVATVKQDANALGASFDGIGTHFTESLAHETTLIQQRLDEYKASTNAIPQSYTRLLETQLTRVGEEMNVAIASTLSNETLQAAIDEEAKTAINDAKKRCAADAQSLWAAMDGAATDENAIFRILRKATPGEIIFIEGVYNDAYAHRYTDEEASPLRADLDDELSGTERDIAFGYLNFQREQALRLELDDSRHSYNDEEQRIEEVLRAASDSELRSILQSDEGQHAIDKTRACLSGCDLDVVNTLLDVDNPQMTRHQREINANAMRIYDAMYGGITEAGTDEAKITSLLEDASDDDDRKELHELYAVYFAKNHPLLRNLSLDADAAKSYKFDGGVDALDWSLGDEMSGGEWTYARALSKTTRDTDEIAMAKLVDGAQGSGTDEDKVFEALDDEEFAQQYKNAKDQATKDALSAAREKRLNEKLDSQKSSMTWRFKGDHIGDILEGELGTAPVTYQELVDGIYGPNSDPAGQPVPKVIIQVQARMGMLSLEAMVAQRKLQTGTAEPELMIAYACWNSPGTDEATIKQALTENGAPRSQAALETLRTTFLEVWGVKLAPENELKNHTVPTTGVLVDELEGRDWFDIRVLLMGKPETPEQIAYIDEQRYKFVTSGTNDISPWSHAQKDMEHAHVRLQNEVADAKGKELASFNAKNGSLDDNRLEILASYAESSENAYLEAKEAFANAVVTILEVIGGALITAATMGAGAPMLTLFIYNMILSGVSIAVRKVIVGDAIGSDVIALDTVKAIVTSAIAALTEAKYLANFSSRIGKSVAGKLLVSLEEGVENGGMKLVGLGLEVGEKGVARLEAAIAAGIKNAHTTALNDVTNFVFDEKTYDMKFDEALFGEHSLGRMLLLDVPRAFASGAVSDAIQNLSGVSSIDHAGKLSRTGQTLWNALATMGGDTAGFFVYLDNYQDAGAFWIELLKTNAKASLGGAFTGYLMHRQRAKKLGRDFMNAGSAEEKATVREHLDDAVGYMQPEELRRLAEFVAKERPELVAELPEAIRALVSDSARNTNTGSPIQGGDELATREADDKAKREAELRQKEEEANRLEKERREAEEKREKEARGEAEDNARREEEERARIDAEKARAAAEAKAKAAAEAEARRRTEEAAREAEEARELAAKKAADKAEQERLAAEKAEHERAAREAEAKKTADERLAAEAAHNVAEKAQPESDDRATKMARKAAEGHGPEEAAAMQKLALETEVQRKAAEAAKEAQRKTAEEAVTKHRAEETAKDTKRQVDEAAVAKKGDDEARLRTEADDERTKKLDGGWDDDTTKKPQDDDAKTRTDDGHQTEKPEEESFGEANARRSKPVKSAKGNDEHWATPKDRQNVPEEVPLSRQELRDTVFAKYRDTLEKFVNNKNRTEDADFVELATMMAEEPAGFGNTPDGAVRLEEYWASYKALLKKNGAQKAAGSLDEQELRVVYNIVEKEDMKNLWFPKLKDLPLEQQSRLASMWREELKLYIRDLMGDDASKEVMYQRDRGAYGDRRGKRFEEFVEDNLAELSKDAANKGKTEAEMRDLALDGVIGSSMRSNEEFNKTATENASGIDNRYAPAIRAAAAKKDVPAEMKKLQIENDALIAGENAATKKQNAGKARDAEVHLASDKPIEKPEVDKAGLRDELNDLWKLRESLKRPGDHDQIKAQIAAKQAAFDRKLADPKHKEALLDSHVVFALAREANVDQKSHGPAASPGLKKFLSENIERVREAQDQARQGADPKLRAKREIFERELALVVLREGTVKRAVDRNLDEMCKKALDYIGKSRSVTERNSALVALGANVEDGYAGAVMSSKNMPEKNAKIMEAVLREGNVRERMIALGKFSELVANDMVKEPDRLQAVVDKSQGPTKQGEFDATDAAMYRERFEVWKKEQLEAGKTTPDASKDGFLKPTSEEKETRQKDFQTAKQQEMDTKIPNVMVNDAESLIPGAKKDTGAGEKSVLARTSTTVKEAIEMGYELSTREIEAAGGLDAKLPWIVGAVANVVDPSAKFIQTGAETSMPQKAGVSGTTFRFMEVSALLGGDPGMSRLAMIGALQVIDAHTIYEIVNAAAGFGMPYDPAKPYGGLGIPDPILDSIAKAQGTTVEELNGQGPAPSPVALAEPGNN